MKILFSSISIKDKPTGVFNRAFVLSKEMVRQGHTVTLLTMDKRFVFPYKIEVRDGVKIVSFSNLWGAKIGKFGYSLLGILFRLIYMLFHVYDVVHSDMHRPLSSIPCLLYRIVRRKSVYVADWQDLFGRSGIYDTKAKFWKNTVGPFDNWLEKYAIKKADGVVPLSDLLKQETLNLGKDKGRILKLWGGSDVDDIVFNTSPSTHRAKFKFRNDAFIILYAAMHKDDYESHRDFFLAVKQLRNDGVDVFLVRTGKPFSISYREANNIGDEIFDIGYVDYSEFGDFLSCANCFVLLQEPTQNVIAKWPNVVGDYLAAGRPIIANVLGELEFLYREKNDTIIPLSSNLKVEMYLDRLKTIVENTTDSIRYASIRDFAMTQFSWHYRASTLVDFYKMIKAIQE